MAWLLQRPYRSASFILVLLVVLLPFGLAKLGVTDWGRFLLVVPFYLYLVVLTFRRLRDIGRSGGWIVLMLLVMNFGPSWDGLAPSILYLSNVLHLVPVALAWLPSRRDVRSEAPLGVG